MKGGHEQGTPLESGKAQKTDGLQSTTTLTLAQGALFFFFLTLACYIMSQ